jgi:hypothetical protein
LPIHKSAIPASKIPNFDFILRDRKLRVLAGDCHLSQKEIVPRTPPDPTSSRIQWKPHAVAINQPIKNEQHHDVSSKKSTACMLAARDAVELYLVYRPRS